MSILTKRPISHDEASECLTRFINSHFRDRKQGETARFSIPADINRDDDLVLSAYIEQQRAKDAPPIVITGCELSVNSDDVK